MQEGNAVKRIADIAEQGSRLWPDAIAIIDDLGSWSFSQLHSAAGRAAAWLRDRGVRGGDRVLLVGENCRPFVALYLGAAALDAWPVLLNANQTAADIERIRRHADARCVVYAAATSKARHLAEGAGGAIHQLDDLGAIGLAAMSADAEVEAVAADPSDRVAALIYTSGSEGEPKGVMLSNANLLFTARVSGELRKLAPGERMYGVLPLTHSLGLSVVALGTLLHGATLRQTARFDPAAMLATLESEGISVLIGMPMMYQLVAEFAQRKGRKRLAAPSLRVISVAGAPLTPAVKEQAEALFGLPLHNGYGVTECSPTISQTRLEAPRTDCSVGPVWPGVEVRLDLPDDEGAGEILVRGPNVMKGYYRNPALSAAAVDPEGWFNTRDLGRLDQDDNLFIVGRSRELIIRFGYKVLPGEIEMVLDRHSHVSRSAVIGVSRMGNDEIIAFLQAASKVTPTDSELATYCAQFLPAYKQPSRFVWVSSFPLTPAGKIRKSELAAQV